MFKCKKYINASIHQCIENVKVNIWQLAFNIAFRLHLKFTIYGVNYLCMHINLFGCCCCYCYYYICCRLAQVHEIYISIMDMDVMNNSYFSSSSCVYIHFSLLFFVYNFVYAFIWAWSYTMIFFVYVFSFFSVPYVCVFFSTFFDNNSNINHFSLSRHFVRRKWNSFQVLTISPHNSHHCNLQQQQHNFE